MADVKISALPASAGLATVDLLAVVDDPGGVPATQRATIAQLVTLLDTIYLTLTGGQLTGNLTFSLDNTMDIGASGATRPRTGFFGTSIVTALLASPAATALSLASAGTTRANFSTTGHLLFNTDNTNDIGAVGATRPRTGYYGTSVISPLLLGGSGAIGAPALSFSGDTNTGFCNIVPDFILISCAGVYQGSFTSSSNQTLSIKNAGTVCWESTGVASVGDIGLSRNAAGIIEVNSATAGTFRDLWARHLRLATAFTVATLPAAGVAGRMAYVTDATAPTYLGALVGGGAVVTPVFDNGAAWVSA